MTSQSGLVSCQKRSKTCTNQKTRMIPWFRIKELPSKPRTSTSRVAPLVGKQPLQVEAISSSCLASSLAHMLSILSVSTLSQVRERSRPLVAKMPYYPWSLWKISKELNIRSIPRSGTKQRKTLHPRKKRRTKTRWATGTLSSDRHPPQARASFGT